MEYVALGKTKLLVSRSAFGAESLDCKEIESFGDQADEVACSIVHNAYDGGVNFFDTSRSKPECERRLGAALHGIRHNVMLATKSSAQTPAELRMDLATSLDNLETDFVDLFQLENPLIVPQKDGKDGLYNELLALKDKGLCRHFGLCTDNLEIAKEAAESGLYEVIQFPFNVISSDLSHQIIEICEKKETGVIAMQPLMGGLITNIPVAVGFFGSFENVVPLWGARTQEQLNQILYFTEHRPERDENFIQEVEKLRMFFN